METGNSEQEQKDDHDRVCNEFTHTFEMCGNAKLGRKFLNNKWLNINDETAYEKITSCSNNIELENLPTFSYNKMQMAKSSEENVQNFKSRKANDCEYV